MDQQIYKGMAIGIAIAIFVFLVLSFAKTVSHDIGYGGKDKYKGGYEKMYEKDKRKGGAVGTDANLSRALVERAVFDYKESGESTFALISDGFYSVGDIYVFAMYDNGVSIAHPVRKDFEGEDISDLESSDGTKIVMRILGAADNKRGRGSWVTYMFEHPDTKEELLKRTYVIKVDDVVFGAGYHEI